MSRRVSEKQRKVFAGLLDGLRSIGYTGDLLRRDYVFQDWLDPSQTTREVAAAAFGQTPVSYGTACFAIVQSGGSPATSLISGSRALGAPIALEVQEDQVVEWKVTTRPSEADRRRVIHARDIPKVMEASKEAWSPTSLLRAKNIGRGGSLHQADFDFGLLPAIESEIRARLDPLLREVLAQARALYPPAATSFAPDQLFRLVFWLLAGKVLHDRDVSPLSEMSGATESEDVIAAVSEYYKEPSPRAPVAVSRYAHSRIWSDFNFRNISADVLATIYEDTLVDSEVRSRHGVHSTPPALAKYIVEHLDFEAVPENERFVLEPCCGRGTFLIAAMSRLRDLLSPKTTARSRHDYLQRMLGGFEIDPFALEVSRLALMLADFPNQDGWRLLGGPAGDVYRSPHFPDELHRARFVLCNPPFQLFSAKERQSLQVRSVSKPAELLHRVLDGLHPDGRLGFVLPQQVLDGRQFREVRRRIAARFAEVRVVSLPDQGVFAHAEVETALLLGLRPKQHADAAMPIRIYSAKVDKRDWPAFRSLFEVSRSNTRDSTVDQAAESLSTPDLQDVWASLSDCQTLAQISTDIHRGIEWNVPLGSHRAELISQSERPGFRPGLASSPDGLLAFEQPKRVFLNCKPSLQRHNAHRLPWERPKVVTNAKRLSRGRWRLSAFADSSGLVCYQTFTCIWPSPGWSTQVLAAILNSPLANAFIAAHESTRDITSETLRRIPVPSLASLDVDALESLTREYCDAVRRSPLESAGARSPACILEDIDDLVFRGYRLSPSHESAIRDYMSGYRRSVNERASEDGWWIRGTSTYKVEILPDADFALRLLADTDRAKVLSALDGLRAGLAGMPGDRINKVARSQDLYVFRATPVLRALLLVRPDRTICVQAIMNRDLVDRYFGSFENAG